MAGKDTAMLFLKNKFILTPIICSIVFAVLIFPSIIDRHGFVKSLYFTPNFRTIYGRTAHFNGTKN